MSRVSTWHTHGGDWSSIYRVHIEYIPTLQQKYICSGYKSSIFPTIASISSLHTRFILDIYSIYTRCIPTMQVFIKYISSIYRWYTIDVTCCPVGGINTMNILDIYSIYTWFLLDKGVFRPYLKTNLSSIYRVYIEYISRIW